MATVPYWIRYFYYKKPWHTFEYGLSINAATKKISKIEKKIKMAAAESSTDNDEDSAASEIESQPREYDDVKSPQFMPLENSAVKK